MTLSLKTRLSTGEPLLVPGAANALLARVIEETGFEALYVSGAGIANTFFGVPDIGLVTLTESTMHVAAIRDAVDIPIIVDADTGFGNAINVTRTVRDLARAGANAIQLEDQVAPKKCGHFEGKGVISTDEMVGKIHAALDARPDDEMLVIARTDARSVLGLDEACDRAERYLAEGADVAFVEAPTSREELAEVPRRVPGPLVANMVEGGKTPQLSLAELGSMGYSVVLYANSSMRAAIAGARSVLNALHRDGDTLGMLDSLVAWEDRQNLVRKPMFDAMDLRYGVPELPVTLPTGKQGPR